MSHLNISSSLIPSGSADVVKKEVRSHPQVFSKQDLLLITLREFFNDKKHLQKMLKILRGESEISLRILDWFTTNYSKKYNISYDMKNGSNIQKFIVYLEYKSQLKAYSKKEFDPFCRRERIMFHDKDDNEFATTVGQLNFFRWAIENKILDYVEENFDKISKDMNQSIHHLYRKNKKKDTLLEESEKEIGSGNEKEKDKKGGKEKKKKIKKNESNSEKEKDKDNLKITTQSHKITDEKEKEKEKEGKRNKRKELSISATKTVNKHNVKIFIQFE